MRTSSTSISFLEFLPVSLFAAILAFAGLSFSWEWAARAWGFGRWLKDFFGVLAILCFLLLCIAYLLKMKKFPALVRAEWEHPVSVSFFGVPVVCLLLLPGLVLPYSKNLAIVLWSSGAVLIFLFALLVLRRWFDHEQEIVNAQPAWVIPVVGTLDVPIVGYRMPIPGAHEICMVFFAIGIMFTLILITLIISRLFFQPPIPAALQPTLLILIAPFALAFSGYESLTGQQDLLASVFYYFNLFLLLLLGSKLLLIPRCCPFRVGWWAVGFPLVATTIASFRYASHRQSFVYQIPAAVLLTLSTGIVFYLLLETLYKMLTGQLFLTHAPAESATRTLEPAISPASP